MGLMLGGIGRLIQATGVPCAPTPQHIDKKEFLFFESSKNER